MHEERIVQPENPDDPNILFEDDGVELVDAKPEAKWDNPREGKAIIMKELMVYISELEKEAQKKEAKKRKKRKVRRHLAKSSRRENR